MKTPMQVASERALMLALAVFTFMLSIDVGVAMFVYYAWKLGLLKGDK